MPITRVYVSGLPDGLLRPDSVGVTIEGTSLGSATHVYLSESSIFIPGAAVSQSVTSVSSTQIVFNVNLGALSESRKIYIWARIGTSTAVADTVAIVSSPDVHIATGSFATPSSGTSVNILDEATLGFRPVAVYLTATGGIASDSSQFTQAVGYAVIGDDDSVVVSCCTGGRNSSSGTKSARNATFSLARGSTLYNGTLSYSSGTLSINFGSTDSYSRRVQWVAIGGRTVLAKTDFPLVSDLAIPCSFFPDLVLAATIGDGTMNGSSSLVVLSQGAVGGSGSVSQWLQAWDVYSSARRTVYKSTHFSGQYSFGGTSWEVAYSTRDETGLEWTGSDTDRMAMLAIYLDGAEVRVGTYARPSSETSSTLTAIDFEPDAIILAATPPGDTTSHATFATGIASASEQKSAWGYAQSSTYKGGFGSTYALTPVNSSGTSDDNATVVFANPPQLSWTHGAARSINVGYVALKGTASASSNEATADTIDITATPRAATATASGTASTSADRIAAIATPRNATATGSGSVNASADRIDSSITVNAAAATPSGAATEIATSIGTSATSRNATATASGTASETATRIDSSATARDATATGSGTAEASATRIAAIATPRDATATPGPASATADRIGGTITARNAVATPSGTATATADTIASTATPRNATGSPEGSSETADTLAAVATPRDATATATGSASDSGSSIAATATPRVATATAAGSASTSASRVSAEATPRDATATPSGFATATASRLGGTATARTAIATATGTASATASRIAATATARDAVGSAEGSSSTAARIQLGTTARVASATASGTASASANTINSPASPRSATATASGTATDSTGSIDATATPRDAIATGSGAATASGERINSSITVRAATATASGAASTPATRLGGTATARAAIATPSGAATAIASRVGPLANSSGATATPEGAQFETAARIHVGITARSAIAINMGIEPAPYPVELSLVSSGIELSIESEGVSLTMPARYHAAVGDLAPKLTMSVGMSLVGHTSLEIRWLLPGEEDVRTGSLVVENAEAGEVSRSWLAGDLDAPDNGQVNVEVTGIDPSGRRWTSTTRYFSLRKRI